MRKTKRSGNRKMTEKDIDMFCMGVQDTLKKIHDRCETKESKKKKKLKQRHKDEFTGLKEMEKTGRMHLVGQVKCGRH